MGWDKEKRIDSKFCDDNCRNKYHATIRKIDRKVNSINRAIDDLTEIMKNPQYKGRVQLLIRDLFEAHNSDNQRWECGECGQLVFEIPDRHQRCDFCQANKWVNKPYKDQVKG